MRKVWTSRPHPRRSEAGFTLVETLIATVIFAIGALAMASLLIATIELNDSGRASVEATILGQWKAEQLMTLNPANADNICPAGCWAIPGPSPNGNLGSVQTVAVEEVVGGVGSGVRFQIWWKTEDITANQRLYHVIAYWPKERNAQGIADPMDPAFIDCAATPAECKKFDLYSYRTF